ncbi:hypothetical protein [Halostella salina]|uniref:hypothetical protein n=1 Tax=Halostella salina TaxID=1547897 RepID=UPI0013CF2416|nr:hypothetical protein [Halostella salina]
MSDTDTIDSLEQLANESRVETFDATLNTVQNALEIDGNRINLGLCIDYEEHFGGDVRYYTYRCGPYEVEVKRDVRKQGGTKIAVEVTDTRTADVAGETI